MPATMFITSCGFVVAAYVVVVTADAINVSSVAMPSIVVLLIVIIEIIDKVTNLFVTFAQSDAFLL